MAATLYDDHTPPMLTESHDSGHVWTPVVAQPCDFLLEHFEMVMDNLIKNPNILSSWLFRADIRHDVSPESLNSDASSSGTAMPSLPQFDGFQSSRVVVRTLIPRLAKRDNPLDQTCVFYQGGHEEDKDVKKSLVVYLPHAATVDEIPFYHPRVRGVAFLHEWRKEAGQSQISIHYLYFDAAEFRQDLVKLEKLKRTSLQLVTTIYKHGQGKLTGYVKKVHHDTLVPRETLQTAYHSLKEKYAKELVNGWMEDTDPSKHVFEDLCIAAFLITLWADMYRDAAFPGFVDIGCGNGLLVYILNKEGLHGWGFDARSRKSWEQYSSKVPITLGATLDNETEMHDSLQQLVLLPSILPSPEPSPAEAGTHDGCFPKGTFIISNHADELTPWTPILAAQSGCPFISIPCCSHDLTGARYRAAPPRDKTKSSSTYSSLVEWTADIATDCGWEVEREHLRIPSTRNAALLGRRRRRAAEGAEDADAADVVDMAAVVRKYGGMEGYREAALKLAKAVPRSH